MNCCTSLCHCVTHPWLTLGTYQMTLIRGTLPALAEHAVMSCVPIVGLATLPLLCCLLQARHPTQLLLCAALAVPCVWDLQAHLHTPSTRVSLHMCLFEPSFCDPNASKLVCACCCVAAALLCCAWAFRSPASLQWLLQQQGCQVRACASAHTPCGCAWVGLSASITCG